MSRRVLSGGLGLLLAWAVLATSVESFVNHSDDELRAIAANGGVVGIGFWPGALCGSAPADVARSVRYVAELVGDDHVALGSDFDGATTVGFDASRMPAVTQALFDAGLSEASVRKVLGANVLRVLRANLPDGAASR